MEDEEDTRLREAMETLERAAREAGISEHGIAIIVSFNGIAIVLRAMAREKGPEIAKEVEGLIDLYAIALARYMGQHEPGVGKLPVDGKPN